jgi:hypothetical protein
MARALTASAGAALRAQRRNPLRRLFGRAPAPVVTKESSDGPGS